MAVVDEHGLQDLAPVYDARVMVHRLIAVDEDGSPRNPR